MTNRAGKRERAARNRHRRTEITWNIPSAKGPVWITAKLGRKKWGAHLHSFLHSKRGVIEAVPVVDR